MPCMTSVLKSTIYLHWTDLVTHILCSQDLCSAGCDNAHCAIRGAICTILLQMGTSHDRFSKINITDRLSANTPTCQTIIVQVTVFADNLSVMLMLGDLQDSTLVKVCTPAMLCK